MEYEINLEHDEFYFPRTGRWVTDTFNISLEQAILFQMILNKEYIIWTLDWLSKVMGYSRMKLVRQLDDMVEKGILIRKTVPVDESGRKRTIYITAYTHEGKRTPIEINSLITRGTERLRCDYSEKRYYRKSK